MCGCTYVCIYLLLCIRVVRFDHIKLYLSTCLEVCVCVCVCVRACVRVCVHACARVLPDCVILFVLRVCLSLVLQV